MKNQYYSVILIESMDLYMLAKKPVVSFPLNCAINASRLVPRQVFPTTYKVVGESGSPVDLNI